MVSLLWRHTVLGLTLAFIAFSVWACAYVPSQVAIVETAGGVRIELRSSKPDDPLDPGTDYHLSAVLSARDGRTSRPIEILVEPEYSRTNLYRTPEGCLVFVSGWGEVAVVEETLSVAPRGTCPRGRIPYNDCPDPTFDPATRPARPLADAVGYLGTFAINRGPDNSLWFLVWQFHHAGDEPECLEARGG